MSVAAGLAVRPPQAAPDRGSVSFGKAQVRYIWSLADGWCFHSLMTGRFGAPANQALSGWIDEAGLHNPLRGVDWLAYNRSTLDPVTRSEWEKAIAVFFRSRTRAQIRTEGRRRGINACVVEAPADVLADPHLRARDFWMEQDGQRMPRRFALLREASSAVDPATWRRRRQRVPVLAGLRVLDFSGHSSGRSPTKILGDLGADVIRSSRTRPCLSRVDVQVMTSPVTAMTSPGSRT
jgi:crotonobetainyl-CoA:carnitine CoA-transferase CaiB-like acyl-CoA transferase